MVSFFDKVEEGDKGFVVSFYDEVEEGFVISFYDVVKSQEVIMELSAT